MTRAGSDVSLGIDTVSLGIDTGGTYTDAVIVSAELKVIGSAKALTTRRDLSLGIGLAIDDVVAATKIAVGDVSMVALSTTLATNALVEGRTGKIAVVTMGLDDEGCRLAGIPDAVGADPWLRLDGGHDSAGAPLAEPNLAAVDRFVATNSSVEGYAVAAQFSVRNPAHELIVRDRIAELSGRPVTCGHELSSALNGPARAVTCVLNARLIGVIDTMLAASERHLAKIGIGAPVLVVRGDGSLMSVAVARKRPVETVLSGPAASVVGAVHLSQQPLADTVAIVADIGGTTTDMALVRDGRPLLSPHGAVVGGHRTMIAAIDIETTGLGGDSEVTVAGPELRLGPRRLIPISMLSAEFPDAVDAVLSSDAAAKVSSARVARLVVLGSPAEDLANRDATSRAILLRLEDGPVSWRELAPNHRSEVELERLVIEGLVTPSGVTPTDAAHVLGFQHDFDTSAARRALELMAGQRDRFGEPIAADGLVLAQTIVDEVHALSAIALLRTGLRSDGLDPNMAVSTLAQMSRATASQPDNAATVSAAIRLTAPVIGVGASAPTYYPQAAGLALTTAECPEHGDVANAVGAVVGVVRVCVEVVVDRPADHQFRLSGGVPPETFTTLDEALERAETLALASAASQAEQRGAKTTVSECSRVDNTIDLNGYDYFVSSTITAIATGRATTP